PLADADTDIDRPAGVSPAAEETVALTAPGTRSSASLSAAELREVGPYDITGELGMGGMGVVFLGRHRLLAGGLAAIKMIRRGGEASDEERRRFSTEAKAAAQLRHENIVPIYEIGTHRAGGEDVPFVAFEYVGGGSLAQKINGTPLPARQAAEVLLPLAEAMHHAHQQGIVHRDLKPANVLLTPEGKPKITDFGLAKRLEDAAGPTQTGAVMGTPSYMAPEQASGRTHEVGPAADVYALGAILYECLTGRPPFKADTVLNTLRQVTIADPVPARALNSAAPRDLETICLKCLHKAPARRYASAGDLADDLRRFLAGEPIRARPVSAWERAAKWVRRRPAAAALLAMGGLMLVAGVVAWGLFTARLKDEKDRADEQRAKADRNAAEARRETDEAKRQAARAERILGIAAGSLDQFATSLRAAKQEEMNTGNTGSVLFSLACTYARASGALQEEKDLPLKDRQRLADQYARGAVKLLICAEQVGYFKKPSNRDQLTKNTDLNPLRSRSDFRSFVASV